MKKIVFMMLLLACIQPAGQVFAQFKDHHSLLTGKNSGVPVPWVQEQLATTYPDPEIVQVIATMSADTIKKNLLHLQNFGSRFMGNANRKEVTQWIADQFASYGFTDVRIDSVLCNVNWPGYLVDTLWEYNITARLEGSSAPGEIYVIGGHYDSFSYEDKENNAPGADDNGSATVVAMEVARVMKLAGYQPQTSIEFTLWAAEELGLFGSKATAAQAVIGNRDLRYVLNLDMVANNPDSIPSVVIGKYEPDTWAADVAAYAYETYTGLTPIIPPDPNPSGSDSYSYYLLGFPTIFVQEITFSPNWHHISDTVGNCNIEYLTEVARGACATLMDQQDHPCIYKVKARSYNDHVGLTWKGTVNSEVAGYNIYRALASDSVYNLVNLGPVTDTFYNDITATKCREYLYRVTSIHPLYGESLPSIPVSGIIYHFSDTLLIVNQLHLNETTPDSIREFYTAVMDTIPFEWYDLNKQNGFSLELLSSHKNILWTTNFPTYEASLGPSYNSLSDFFSNGGNMMISGFYPGKMTGILESYPYKAGEGSILRDYFKSDSVNSKNSCLMYRAYPVTDDYDTLHIDLHKSMTAGYPGEIYRVESHSPVAGANIIYRLDSHYPATSPFGIMQDWPVGQEYMGNDFRTILLGFSLLYLDTADAKALMKDVLTNKFTHPTGIGDQNDDPDNYCLSVSPNPFTGLATIAFKLASPGNVRLFVLNMQGVKVLELLNARLAAGDQRTTLAAGSLPPGLYNIVLVTDDGICSRTAVHVR